VSPVFENVHISPTAVANPFFLLFHVTGQPVVGLLPMASQGAVTTTIESTVIVISSTTPVVRTAEAFGARAGDEMIAALKDDSNDEIMMLKNAEETS